jgi:hypothetical protein
MRCPLTTPDQRHVPERETGRTLESVERNRTDEREDVALEGGQVDELPVLIVPLPRLTLARDVRFGAAMRCLPAVCPVNAGRLLVLDRGEP